MTGVRAGRVVEVAPERLAGWRERFAVANPEGPQRLGGLERFDHDPLAVVLVRRGGYAVGLAEAGRLVAHKVGTRHVQSRTAAGGWSQQRFARRRANQADALVGAVRDHAVRLLSGVGATASGGGLPSGAGLRGDDVRPPTAGLVVGGDRALVAEVLADARLAALAALPRRELYDLPDPRLDVLRRAVERGRAVRVTVHDASP
ncbi:MAG TPA: Vms1/Ankzf1 family peptidyl-tRNA hydrolase [Dermatophilaceae bacterium]|nr:Vms1/Ankzf1 family peptidyl-tRNA hydrolase [Dermatophilaceae bacterium]